MRRSTALFSLVLAACSAPPALTTSTPPSRDAFDERFTGRTMRFDYFHSGTATEAVSYTHLRAHETDS